MKLVFFILGTMFCAVLGLWPEAAMYFLYNVIAPSTEESRLLVILAFWFGGIGLSIGFGAIAFIVWISILSAVT